MEILVVLVGNSPKKLKRLQKLYANNIPKEKHRTIVVYNGSKNYNKINLYVPNNIRSKDIGMYYEAVKNYKADFYFFLNDDIIYIKDNNWLYTALKLQRNAEVIGVQTNLSSIISMNTIKKIATYVPAKWSGWGINPKFIRTSAFGCTREYFLRVWKASDGNGQKFEKNTLKLANSFGLFNDPFYIFDENLKPYFKYLQGNNEKY